MSKVVRTDVDKLNTVLTVTVEKNDFVSEYNSELQKYRKGSNMKGFRKGKTPISVLKKMYGKQLLSEIVGNKFTEVLDEYIGENELAVFGRPLPSEDQELLDFDLKNVTDYTLNFDIGLHPEFEIGGISNDNSYMHYVVEVPEERVSEELEKVRRQLGTNELVTDDIDENDMLKLATVELDENGEFKDDGVESEFSVLVSTIADDDLKEEILAKKAGDVVRFNIYKIEKERMDDEGNVDLEATKRYVNKQLLHLEESEEREINEMFEARIESVSRLVPAELNQEFYDKVFVDDEVSSEAEARATIEKYIAQQYQNRSNALLFRDMHRRIIEDTTIELPKDFLKRWIVANNTEMDIESAEAQWEDTANHLKWTLIKNKISEEKDIQVTEEDIRNEMVNIFIGQYGVQMADYANMFVENMMKDEKQVNRAVERVSDNKVFLVLKENLTLQDSSVSIEELEEKLEQVYNAAKAENADKTPQLAEEEE